MLQRIYLITLLLITCFFIYLYFSDWSEYKKEIERIKRIEKDMNEEKNKLKLLRNKTVPCSIHDLDTPKSCFIGSNQMCKWSTVTKRCDKI